MNEQRSNFDSVKVLQSVINLTDRNIKDFSNRHFNKKREHAVIHLLERAADLAKGAILSIEGNYVASAHILIRGLLESLIQLYWMLHKAENLEIFSQAFLDKSLQYLEENLKLKFGTFRDRETGEERNHEILNYRSANAIIRVPKIEKMAQTTGLERLYTVHYRSLSNYSHGYTFHDGDTTDLEREPKFVVSAAPFLYGINAISEAWIISRRRLTVDQLYQRIGYDRFGPLEVFIAPKEKIELTLEHALLSDVDLLNDILLNAIKTDARTYPNMKLTSLVEDARTQILKSLEQGNFYKVIAANQIIGGIAILAKNTNHYHLDTIFLTHQYSGVATQLMKLISEEYPNAKWTINLPSYAVQSHHFIESIGFVRLGEIEVEGNTLVCYEKSELDTV